MLRHSLLSILLMSCSVGATRISGLLRLSRTLKSGGGGGAPYASSPGAPFRSRDRCCIIVSSASMPLSTSMLSALKMRISQKW